MKRKRANKFVYGVGNLGYSVISQTITNFFMFYGTSVLKVSGVLVGVAVAISTFWDGFTDPIVGYISDRRAIKGFGHRTGYMLIATFGMALFNLFIWFIPVDMSEAVKFLWILFGLIAIETFNTLYSTPYMALSSDIGYSYHERTLVQVSKTIFLLVGMVISSLLLYVFLPNSEKYPIGQLNPHGYRGMAVITSIICVICGLICVFGTRKSEKVHSGEVSRESFSLKRVFSQFLLSLKNTQQRTIILGYSISLLSAVMLTSVGMHFFTYCFNFESKQITILLSSLIFGTIVSQPLWFYISKKHDKKPALLSSIFVSVVGVFCIITLFLLRQELGNASFYLILVSIFVCGFGSGALYSLPTSMFNDIIIAQNKASGKNNTATYTGMLTFSCNVVNSIATLIIGGLLDIIGFNPDNPTQTLSVQTGLALILFVGVQVALISGYYIFSKFNMKSRRKNQQQKSVINK